jgi:hypothetical protein
MKKARFENLAFMRILKMYHLKFIVERSNSV